MSQQSCREASIYNFHVEQLASVSVGLTQIRSCIFTWAARIVCQTARNLVIRSPDSDTNRVCSSRSRSDSKQCVHEYCVWGTLFYLHFRLAK